MSEIDHPDIHSKARHKILNYLIALVWLVNGLICKVLYLVPRHEQIVARIAGNEFSRPLTLLIGFSEMAMSGWILSGYRSKLNAIFQIAVVALMNFMEFILVPDLLLWGRLNSVFALMFIGTVYYNEFVVKRKLNPVITQ